MCGIAGFSEPGFDYTQSPSEWQPILARMNRVQKHRGPDDEGVYLQKGCGLSHVRLSILDLKNGHQPMLRRQGKDSCAIVFNGEIYNMQELKRQLELQGQIFQTTCDTEVILAGYMQEGVSFVKRLNGIFAFAIWDSRLQTLFLFRDRLGVKPLFYTIKGETLVFSSEIKGLFAYPNIRPVLDHDSLCEVFGLGPAKTYGKGVFRGVFEVLPGHYMTYAKEGLLDHVYWKLQSRPHEDSEKTTVEKTSFLLLDAIRKQMLSDIPICTFLSGGVDSSLVTAVCASELKKQGKVLNTFSFDFENNDRYFRSNAFQPSQDRPWVDQMVKFSQTRHRYLECKRSDLLEALYRAVDARDLPCMADVESSMLYFCSLVANFNQVALTGECADEIFGGYPWFHKQECLNAQTFPWSMDLSARTALLSDATIAELRLKEYVQQAYQNTIEQTPRLLGESAQERRRREIAYLNLKWFMATLLDRMDRTSMHVGLEARVPFADHRIVEYVFNVPWEMKCRGGLVKGLLREAADGLLPDEILYRRKSPYPKTYDPDYENLLGKELLTQISDNNAPICAFIDKAKVARFLNSPTDYGKPFYGQLMAGPQMLAFMLQVNYWLKRYHVTIL